jgi:hypothetical protein
MACLTINGIGGICNSSIGGIKKIAMVPFSDFEITTQAAGEITAMTSSTTPVGYDFLKDNSSLTSAFVGDNIMASSHIEDSVAITFRKMSIELRQELTELIKDDVVIFITDNNLNTWAIGTDRGALLTDSAGFTTGLGMTELNGVQVTFKTMETYLPLGVDLTAVGEPFLSLLS